MDKKLLSLGIAALALAACTSAPSAMFASEVGAAKDASRPVMIYQLYIGRYNTVGVGVRVNAGFVNTSGREIDQVVMQITAYAGGRALQGDDGKVLTGTVTAEGPFVPDQSYAAQSGPIWAMRGGAEASGYVECPRLTGISVHFTDGSTLQAEGAQARSYLAPELNGSCTRAPYLSHGDPSLGH